MTVGFNSKGLSPRHDHRRQKICCRLRRLRSRPVPLPASVGRVSNSGDGKPLGREGPPATRLLLGARRRECTAAEDVASLGVLGRIELVEEVAGRKSFIARGATIVNP